MIFRFDAELFNIKTQTFGSLKVDTISTPNTPKVLLIHGVQGSSRAFYPLMSEMSKMGVEPWAINLRGHGLSDPFDLKNTHLEDYLDDVHLCIKEIQPTILLGHSLGGMLAQKAASKDHQIKGLILLSSLPPFSIPWRIRGIKTILWAMIKYSYLIFKGQYLKKMATIGTKQLSFNKILPKTLGNLRKAIKKNKELVKETPHLLHDIRKGNLREIDPFRQDLEVLVFGAQYDYIIDFNSQRLLADQYKGQFVLAHHSGHMLIIGNDFNIIIYNIKLFLNNMDMK